MSPSSFRLHVKKGPNLGMLIDVSRDVMVIGRDVTNDIVVADAEVSRQHARLKMTKAGLILEDLGSTNGTHVNGERISAPRVLKDGDEIGLGENAILALEELAPEEAATVVRPARAAKAAKPAAARPSMQPIAPEPLEAEGEAKAKKPIRPWIFAGCGCLLVLVVGVVFLWFMDAYYPETLWGPVVKLLQLVGLY
jgi:pSer/pThr/pTyr-binding forkhead associated (FHA) protein